MDTWLIALLIVVFSLIGLYVLFVVTGIGFYQFFANALRKHKKALRVILNTKYDNCKELIDFAKENNVSYDNSVDSSFEEVSLEDFNHLEDPKFKKALQNLTYIKDTLFYEIEKNPSLALNDHYEILKDGITELDKLYRSSIALYNADVLGYNYWIAFLPSKWVFKVRKIKAKEIIT